MIDLPRAPKAVRAVLALTWLALSIYGAATLIDKATGQTPDWRTVTVTQTVTTPAAETPSADPYGSPPGY